MNAITGATGLSRPFGNVNSKTGSIGHDGVHVLGPAGSKVKTLAALVGTVIGNPHQQSVTGADSKLFAVDVLLPNGLVAIYKDLATVNVHAGQKLSAGKVIGTIGGGTGEAAGLHFSLLKGGLAGDQHYRSLTSKIAALDHSDDPKDWQRASDLRQQLKESMFINPLGQQSPVNCPGVHVDPAGVNPAP